MRTRFIPAALRERVEAACERGAASIHSTGSSPGVITEAVALVLTSIQRRLDGLTIDEFAHLSQRNSPGLLFDVMGFGKPPAAVDERRLSHGRIAFGPSLQLVAEALSLPLDSLERAGGTDGGHHARVHGEPGRQRRRRRLRRRPRDTFAPRPPQIAATLG
jgi:2,4-diaminopentanoate dehydrogenase